MKIQNINIFKTNLNNNFKTYNPMLSKTPPMKYDSVSFGYNLASKTEIEKLQSEAIGQLKVASEIFTKSQKVANEANDMLSASKDAFLIALKDIEAIKKLPHTGMIVNPKGNVLSFAFEVSDDVKLQYSESTTDGKLIRLVTAKNFIPEQITEFDGKFANIYTYNGDNVSVTKNINVTNDDFGKCEGVFGYKNGILNRASINGNPTVASPAFENVYFFDKNSNLKIGAVQYTNKGNGYSCVTEFLFENNGRLQAVFNNYNEDGKTGMDWARSYHYLLGGLVARLESCEQPYGLDKIYFDNAIYPNKQGRYMTDYHASCRLDEYGDLKF